MNGVVLDASAVIAFLRREHGYPEVADVIGAATIGSVNFSEVVAHFIHHGMPATEVAEMLALLRLRIVPADEGLAYEAGYLRRETASAGLSLGDRFCLALARREGLPAWTADRQWAKVADAVGIEVVTIR